MKLFKTNDINTVKHCQREFNFDAPSDILAIGLYGVNDLKLDIACVTTFSVNICEDYSMHILLVKV